MSSYKDLTVWKKSIEFVKKIYKTTTHFPESEKFGLVSQMRRSAISIPSNIAEGALRSSKRDFYKFLRIAKGSLAELETQLIISHKLDFIGDDEFNALSDELKEISKMLAGLAKSLRVSTNNSKLITDNSNPCI